MQDVSTLSCTNACFTDPANKKAEGACGDICDDDFAICVNDVCKCSGNFVPLIDYTCGEYATLRFHN